MAEMMPRKKGHPKGTTNAISEAEICAEERREGSRVHNRTEPLQLTEECASTSSSSKSAASNRNVYLLKQTLDKFAYSKLPKQLHVLQKFLYEFERCGTIKDAAATTANELCDVWKFHFGLKLIIGKEHINDKVDETMKLVIKTYKIENKIKALYNEWKELQKTSKRKDRCTKERFKTKENNFVETLDNPMDISKANCEDILKRAKIIEWKADLIHLKQQLSKEQLGCAMGSDMKQEARDRAKRKREADSVERKERESLECGKKFRKVEMESSGTESGMEGEDYDSSEDVNVRDKTSKQKKDIIGLVSPTADRLGISIRKRAMMAASVVKATGQRVEDTNISVTSAWRRAQKERIKHAEDIKRQFDIPTFVLVHWDGKKLILRKGLSSERCCVYISGVPGNQKLLGIPEIPSGTGTAQENAVTTMLSEWHISDQVIGIVFDTTAANTGKWRGACSLLEMFVGRAILWVACRHHVYELHIKHVAECVTGQTKDPGVKVFRRLQAEWSSMENKIDYTALVKFSWEESDPWLCQIARSVLIWARQRLQEKTFPRDDYKELITLLVVWLGDEVQKFRFMYPGADHHARWMSKAIYFLKLALLQSQFSMSPEELKSINRMANFVGLFYAKAFLESSLNTAAPRNDLKFISDIALYGQYDEGVSQACIASCNRHTWYLTPQLVIIAIVDEGVPGNEREMIAQSLFATDRPKEYVTGKPKLPQIDCNSNAVELRDFISSDSWLLFDLLGLHEQQDWLQASISTWDNFPDFKKFMDACKSLHVVNDIAERGIKLISDFIETCHDEEQRQALLQCVEDHREQFKKFDKDTLARL